MDAQIGWLRDERGQSLIEMAIIGSLLVLILVAAVEYGRVMHATMVASTAARVGADYGAFNPDASLQDIGTVVQEKLGDLGDGVSVVIVPQRGVDVYGNYVEVTITLDFADTSLFPMPTVTRTVRLPVLSSG
jgi:Flp pilus assembly protein TadG